MKQIPFNTVLKTMFGILCIASVILITTAFSHNDVPIAEKVDKTGWLDGKVYVEVPKVYEYKDITGDGAVDITDLIVLIEFVKTLDAMDIDDNNKIDMKDIELLSAHMFPGK